MKEYPPLLPCPFCGSSNVQAQIVAVGEYQEKHRVKCQGCGARTALATHAEWAEADWNRRVSMKFTKVSEADALKGCDHSWRKNNATGGGYVCEHCGTWWTG